MAFEITIPGTVMVTGAGDSTGKEGAIALAQAGAHVIVVDKDPERVAEVVALTGGTGVVCDMLDPEQVLALRDVVQAAPQPFVGLVNVIERSIIKPWTELTHTDWIEQLKMTFLHAPTVVQALHDLMAPGSAIVLVTSETARVGLPDGMQFTAFKSAMNSLTRSLAVELGPLDIRINAVSAGMVSLPRHMRNMKPEAMEAWGKGVPLGRVGTTEELAKVALFLVSDMSSYMTGQIVTADGGWNCVMANPLDFGADSIIRVPWYDQEQAKA